MLLMAGCTGSLDKEPAAASSAADSSLSAADSSSSAADSSAAESSAAKSAAAVLPSPGSLAAQLFTETVNREDGTSASAERGVVRVPYIRGPRRAKVEDGDKDFELEFYRFARSPRAAVDTPPIFLLRGGPGFEGLRPYLDRPGYFENLLEPYLDIADLVVVGQRGIGTSAGTPCDSMQPLPKGGAVTEADAARVVVEAATRCRDKWLEAGVPLEGFNVIEAAADVRDVARALGYSKIQLRAVSFGSHWSMAIMRYHSEIVERAVLGGLEGPDHTYDMPSGLLAALERMAKQAEASPALAGKVPEGGLMAAFAELVKQVETEPIVAPVTDSTTGVTVDVTISAGELRPFAKGYSRGTAWRHVMHGWPVDLLTMVAGDWSGVAEAVLEERTGTYFPSAAFFGLDCGSGISTERGARLRSDPAADIVGELGWFYDTACPVFGHDLGEDFRRGFVTDIPTVMVQGTWDTSTPYENAVELKPSFTNLHFVTVEGGSHGALREAEEDVAGFRAAVAHFAATGDASQIPQHVDLPPLEWQAPET